MLGGFSFRAGEHTTSAVREIAGPNQNYYNSAGETCWRNLLEKRARSIFDDSFTLSALFELQKDPRDPQGPGPKGSPGARAQGIPWGPGPRDP